MLSLIQNPDLESSGCITSQCHEPKFSTWIRIWDSFPLSRRSAWVICIPSRGGAQEFSKPFFADQAHFLGCPQSGPCHPQERLGCAHLFHTVCTTQLIQSTDETAWMASPARPPTTVPLMRM